MTQATDDVWDVLATARAIRRFTDEPVDQATLDRCLEAATWAPSGGNVQHWRFIVLDSPEMRAVVQQAADAANSSCVRRSGSPTNGCSPVTSSSGGPVDTSARYDVDP